MGTHSIDEHGDGDLNREFERIVPRHVQVCVLVLGVEPEFGSQGCQRLLEVTNKALVESEDLVGISAEQLHVFLRKNGACERQVFLGLDTVTCSNTFSADSGSWVDRRGRGVRGLPLRMSGIKGGRRGRWCLL